MEVNISLDFKARIYPIKQPSVQEKIKLDAAEVYLNHRLDLLRDKLQKEFQSMWDNQSPLLGLRKSV